MSENSIESLTLPIKLSFPVIHVTTFENHRAEQIFENIAEQVDKLFISQPFKKLPDPTMVKSIASDIEKQNKTGAVIFDPYFFERMKANPETLPALKASLLALEKNGINYVIAGKDSFAEEFAYHTTLPSMSEDEILTLLNACEKIVSDDGIFTDEERKVICNHARGLSHTQQKNVMTMCSYLRYKGLDYLPEIRKEKAHILRDVGLDVLDSIPISEVGGLDNLKEFLQVRKAGWERDLPTKGVLLAGVPGGGKTLIAQATAGVFGTTLVKLDMSSFYSKYLGETERLFTRALETIDQIAPVTVLIDEMDKAFFTDGEHEVSRRLLGVFLFWLQARRSKVFIVATANRIHSMPPELMRAGRWDRAFFIDLPQVEERQKILQIHLSKHGADLSKFDIAELINGTQGYTGAEIEQAVIDALYLANAEDVPLNSEILGRAMKSITPTSETRREDIDKIRLLKQQGFYPANAEVADARSVPTRRVDL